MRPLEECDARARQIINENRKRFDRIVEVLKEKETLRGPEFQALWNDAA